MKVNQSNPTIGIEEYISIKDCFDSNWFTEGAKTKQFEEEIKEMVDVNYGVCCPNGTQALYLALVASGLKRDDEVIVPNSTFIATATSVIMAGGIPKFVDVDKDNFQIDVEKCEKIITENTKFIIPVHLWGYACNMDKILEFAKKYNLIIIEDACQALNISWKEKKCGSFGKANAFSFFSDKSLSTVEGGFVATNEKKIYENLMYLKNQGRLRRGSFIHDFVGQNFRLNDIQSSIGLVQLKKFPKMIARRLEVHNMYKENLKNISQIKIVDPPNNSTHIPFRTILITENGSQDLMNYLLLNEIEPRSLFYPLHMQPAFKELRKQFNYQDEDFSNSIYAFEHGVCLPCYPNLTNEQVLYVCEKIKEYYSVH